jgi:hypothetical protein
MSETTEGTVIQLFAVSSQRDCGWKLVVCHSQPIVRKQAYADHFPLHVSLRAFKVGPWCECPGYCAPAQVGTTDAQVT